MEGGFVVKIGASLEERTKLAAKINWLEKNKNHDLPEGRKYRRIAPRSPLARLVLGDGTRMTCLVIDMSAGGAAAWPGAAPCRHIAESAAAIMDAAFTIALSNPRARGKQPAAGPAVVLLV